MNDLRDNLMMVFEKLADEYASTKGAPTPDHLRRVYADEVVRQMEWARELGILWCEQEGDYGWGRPGRTDPSLSDELNTAFTGTPQELTLAPDDWKP